MKTLHFFIAKLKIISKVLSEQYIDHILLIIYWRFRVYLIVKKSIVKFTSII